MHTDLTVEVGVKTRLCIRLGGRNGMPKCNSQFMVIWRPKWKQLIITPRLLLLFFNDGAPSTLLKTHTCSVQLLCHFLYITTEIKQIQHSQSVYYSDLENNEVATLIKGLTLKSCRLNPPSQTSMLLLCLFYAYTFKSWSDILSAANGANCFSNEKDKL